jgi:hypothetical protein
VSLNNEWSRLKNTGNRGRLLRNWRIRNIAGDIYRVRLVHTSCGLDGDDPHRPRLQLRAAPLLAAGPHLEQRRRHGNAEEVERVDRGHLLVQRSGLRGHLLTE